MRKHRSDEKWGLVAEFSRLVAESKPDFVTMENVPQLELHPVFGRLCNTLRQEGFVVSYRVIECAHLGVPQTRKRLVLLASRTGDLDLETEPQTWPFTTVRDAIGHLKPLSAGESDPSDSLHTACRLSELNLKRIRASRPGGTWRDWDRSLRADCHRKKTGDTYPSVYGRMLWDEPAPTITTQSFGYGNGRFGHPEQDRAITLREAALLQTFPESYQFVPKGCRPTFHVLGRLIGNAVPVRLGEFVAAQILATEGVKRAARRR